MAQKKKRLETAVHGVFLLLGLITVGCVLLITVYLIVSGIPAIRTIGLIPFLFGRTWASTAAEPQYGILPFILTSVYGTAGAIALGVPVGFLTAVYLSKAAPKRIKQALEAAVSRAVDDPAEFCADLCVPLGYRTFDVLSDGARTVITASRFVGELEVCNASLIFTFSGSTLTTVTGTFLPPIDTSESGETALDAVTALVRFLDYRNASGAVCTGITWLSAGYLVQSTTSAPLQLVPVLRVDTDVYSYYVNIVSGEVSRVSA